jgi:hypothetical protein
MTTTVKPNDYNFEVKTTKQGQIKYTNSTTRDIKAGEMVVVTGTNTGVLIGICTDARGIAASGGVGYVDLYEGQEISTNQYTVASFVDGDLGVWVLPQTNSSQALIKQASTVGAYPLDALIVDYDATNLFLRLRMPYQAGTAAIVT